VKLLLISPFAFVFLALVAVCGAQEIRVPATVSAGVETTISTSGSGEGTLYLLGPGVARKDQISLGQEVRLRADDLKHSGEYLVVVCSDSCRSAKFQVNSVQPASVVFLVHPSRVPVGQPDAVSGVAVPFDEYGNLVVAPLTVNFRASSAKETLLQRSARTQGGVSWFRAASGKAAGPVQVDASLDALTAHRVVQQVASEPCNLRIRGQRTAKGIIVETEPVKDCSGNLVSDGTIVTFSATGPGERSTIDAPIKGGVAQARIIAPEPIVVSVASGVAMGNELHIGAKP
jgi:hypothetical protein